MTVFKAAVMGLIVLVPAGCADTYWERALYQGAAYGTQQCQLQRNAAKAPCTTMPDFETYERDRERARSLNASPPDARVFPIEEQQQ